MRQELTFFFAMKKENSLALSKAQQKTEPGILKFLESFHLASGINTRAEKTETVRRNSVKIPGPKTV
jgi:hypothetical protein